MHIAVMITCWRHDDPTHDHHDDTANPNETEEPLGVVKGD